MNRKDLAVAFAAAALVVPARLAAQTSPAEQVTLVQWGERVGKELNQRIRYPTMIGGIPFATGVVRVKFNCSENGRPNNVAVIKGSGSRALDKAAVEAVQHVATLHPLPDGMGHDQPYQAVILFETDQNAYDRALARIRADAVKSNAWFKGPGVAASQVGPIMIAGR